MTRDSEVGNQADEDGQGITRRVFLSRGAAAGGAVMLGAGALAGCSSSSTASSGSSGTSASSGSKPGVGTGTPRRGGSATFGITAEIDGFYPPTNHWDINGFVYANTVYDSLMALAADGTIKPNLAKSITPNATFDKWTMTLRPGIKFNDGSPLDSAVVKANYDELASSALTGTALDIVKSVDTPDDMTVVYNLTVPIPAFPAGLTTQVGYVVGLAMIQQAKSNPSGKLTPVGTGPFIYSQWQPNDHFTATRNPHYWRTGLPYLDQVTFKPIPDTNQREATLRTGGVDLIVSTDPDTIHRFSGESSYQVVDTLNGVIGEPSMAFIMLNTAVTPTSDLRVRQALAKGLDQAQLQKIFGGGYTKPVNGLFIPGSPYYSKDTGYPTFDKAGAQKLVNEYKADHGTPSLSLMTIPDPRITQLVQIVQQMWDQVGFDVTIKSVEQATLISDFVTGKYTASVSYQFGAVDPGQNYVWFSTTTVAPIGGIGLNFARNKDPQIETAMLTGRSTTDQATRIAAYKKVNELLAKDLPYLWIEQYIFSEVGDSRLQNFANRTLPDGSPGVGFYEGIFWPTQMWLAG